MMTLVSSATRSRGFSLAALPRLRATVLSTLAAYPFRRPLDGALVERGERRSRHRHREAPGSDQPHRRGRRLDDDRIVDTTDLQRQPRQEPRLPPDLPGDHDAP